MTEMLSNHGAQGMESRRIVILTPDHAQRNCWRFWNQLAQYQVGLVALEVFGDNGYTDSGGDEVENALRAIGLFAHVGFESRRSAERQNEFMERGRR